MATERNPDWAHHPVRIVITAAAVTGYSWLAGGTASFTTASTIAVAIPWAVLAFIGLRWPPERIRAPERLDVAGASYWAIVAITFFEWEASAFRDGSGWWHPSFSNAVAPLLAQHLVKSVAFAVWLAAGWGLMRR